MSSTGADARLTGDARAYAGVVVDAAENVHPPGLDEFHTMYAAEHT